MDFSSHSQKALETAVALAKTFDATIHILHAYHLYVPLAFPVPTESASQLLNGMHDAMLSRLQELREKIHLEGVSARIELIESVPTEAIVASAERIPADLVVMGTRGLTGVKHVLLGSVAERTVRLAPCPVMTVKEQDAD
jgi:nucleotide-binding universal stress UspA family protein